MIYIIVGICSMITLPMVGKLNVEIGSYPTFLFGAALAMIMIVIYTNLPPSPIWMVDQLLP